MLGPGRWLSWLHVRRRDRDIDEEIRTHLEMATRERIERGHSLDEARFAALREFGNVAKIRQSTREVWSWTALEQCLQDLRFGARILRQSPGLSFTAVLLVALVIGGNTTIYSMVNALLVSPAAGVTAPRLVAIKHVEPGMAIADPFISYPNYQDYARETTTIERLTAFTTERLTIGTERGSYAIFGALVTSNYFETLGVSLAHGRGFRTSDDHAADGLVAVISNRVWSDRFDRAPDTVGRAIRINGVQATIVGITAGDFSGALITPGEEVWLPLEPYYRTIGSTEVLRDRSQPLVCVVGRRAPGAPLAQVRAEFDAMVAQIRASFPDAFTTYGARGVTPMKNPRVTAVAYSGTALLAVADMAPTFLALFSVVTLLTLVIVSANVANLMLGRAVIHQRDVAVRQSLGASRSRIVRMLAAEGLAIAAVAWGAACVFAMWTARAVLQLIEPRPGLTAAFAPDWTLAAYAMVLAAVATLSFTLAPALRAWKLPVLPLLRSGEQGIARGRSRLSNTLVVLQLAFSVLLITSAGLAYRSISMLDSGDVGFDADRLLLVTVRAGERDASVARQPTREQATIELARLERVRERLAELAGVSAVSYSRRVPGPYAMSTQPVRIAGSSGTEQTFVRAVGPHYLGALGLTPLAGRDLSPADRYGAVRVAVINQQLARHLFGSQSPIGHRITIDDRRESFEVVGIAPDARFDGPVHDPQPRYMFTARQQAPDDFLIDMTFFIRHDTPIEALAPAVSSALSGIDPGMPIAAMATMRSRLNQVALLERQLTMLLIVFAVASLVVAALGQYAVAMFDMRRRTREFGVHLALGATPHRIQLGVIRQTLLLTVPGLAVGLGLSVGVAALFRSALFRVEPVDPPTYGAVIALLLATSAVAAYLPAWRAGRVNVVDALRQE